MKGSKNALDGGDRITEGIVQLNTTLMRFIPILRGFGIDLQRHR